MNIGADNKKQVIAMVALLAILVVVALYNFRDQLFPSNASAASSVPPPVPPKTTTGLLPTDNPADDPRLRTDVLTASRGIRYEAGRNIFRMEEADIPKTITEVRSSPPKIWTVPEKPTPTPTPPPPPIPLNYYGFASKPGEPKKIFLQQKVGPGGPSGPGGAIFVVAQGETVDRRYKVVQIQANSVTMEDLLTKSQQDIKLTPRPQ